jgi:hypothetical protein
VCYNLDYWFAEFRLSFFNFTSLFLVLSILLRVPPLVALCVVLWEKCRKEWKQTGVCTVLDKYHYCSILSSVFCCILLGDLWKTNYFG